MKNILLLLTILTLLVACDKDSKEATRISAIVNGQSVEFNGAAETNDNSLWDFRFRHPDRSESFLMQETPKREGEYSIGVSFIPDTMWVYALYYIDNDTSSTDIYVAGSFSTPIGELIVNDYNRSANQISGTFDCVLHIDPPKKNPENPDSIIIENGQFTVNIKD